VRYVQTYVKHANRNDQS